MPREFQPPSEEEEEDEENGQGDDAQQEEQQYEPGDQTLNVNAPTTSNTYVAKAETMITTQLMRFLATLSMVYPRSRLIQHRNSEHL
jgi:hypothetical protein